MRHHLVQSENFTFFAARKYTQSSGFVHQEEVGESLNTGDRTGQGLDIGAAFSFVKPNVVGLLSVLLFVAFVPPSKVGNNISPREYISAVLSGIEDEGSSEETRRFFIQEIEM